jgi:ATP-dependent RNA helicase DeaD
MSSTEPITFESFGLRGPVLKALTALGYEEPTPIQKETIPALLQGRDVLGQAATGTGKTAAFALPLLEKINPAKRQPFTPQALVLVPTRELAMQVCEAIEKYGSAIGVTALAVYGGQEIFNQIRPLKRGVDVVVATPGRALDHIKRKSLILGSIAYVVLDEADEMLDMGFADDLDLILSELPDTKQTALFSATMPSRIVKIAEKHLNNPMRVTIAPKEFSAGTVPNIRQAAYLVPRKMKEAALMRVLEVEEVLSAIVFCRTRNDVENLTHALMVSGYGPAAIHGGLTQEQRDGVLRRFKEGAVRILVATDVAARGLHVENLSHVINFDLPVSPEPYVHRIGRTGRAGKEGVALSLFDSREMNLLRNIERTIKKKIPLETVPSIKDLQGKRQAKVAGQVKTQISDKTTKALASTLKVLQEGDTSLEDIASAALAMLQMKMFPPHASDAVEFSKLDDSSSSPRKPRSSAPRPGVRGFSDRPARSEARSFEAREAGPRDSASRGPRSFDKEDRPSRAPRSDRTGPGTPRADMARLVITLGSHGGVRPQDIVGAIANEANISSKLIGGIEIREMDSSVDVPRAEAQRILDILKNTSIRGRKFRVEFAKATGAGSVDAALPFSEDVSKKSFGGEKPPFKKSGFAKPAFEKPPFEKPAFEKPAFEKPAFEKPAYEKPAFEKPKFEKRSFEKPAFEKPPYEKKFDGPKKSFDKKPYDKEAYGKPKFDKPKFEKPAFDKSKIEKPAYEKPKFEVRPPKDGKGYKARWDKPTASAPRPPPKDRDGPKVPYDKRPSAAKKRAE